MKSFQLRARYDPSGSSEFTRAEVRSRQDHRQDARVVLQQSGDVRLPDVRATTPSALAGNVRRRRVQSTD